MLSETLAPLNEPQDKQYGQKGPLMQIGPYFQRTKLLNSGLPHTDSRVNTGSKVAC